MKRIAMSLIGVGAVAVVCLAGPGTVAVTNVQANSVWRPTVVAVRCPDTVSRTVTVRGGLRRNPHRSRASWLRCCAFRMRSFQGMPSDPRP